MKSVSTIKKQLAQISARIPVIFRQPNVQPEQGNETNPNIRTCGIHLHFLFISTTKWEIDTKSVEIISPVRVGGSFRKLQPGIKKGLAR